MIFDSIIDHVLEEYDAELVNTSAGLGGDTAHFVINGESICVQVEEVRE